VNCLHSKSADDDKTHLGFLDTAQEIARTIDNLEGRSELLALIAFKYAESGQLDVGVDVAETIGDSYQRDQALAGLAARCIRFDECDYADQLAGLIEDDGIYATAIEEMALAYVESGAAEKSTEVAGRVGESAPILSRIGLECVARGQTDQALAVARSIDYADLKAPVLVELAARAYREGRDQEALERLLEATDTADEIEFPEQQIFTLATIALLNKKCGQEQAALEILERAHRLCHESEGFDKDSVLTQVAGGFAELGNYGRAGQVRQEIKAPFQYADASVKMASACYPAGDIDRALTLLKDAAEIARNEQVYGEQTMIMRENMLDALAICYATIGHYDEALQVIELMISLDQQNRTQTEISKLCVSSGNNNRAFEVSRLIKSNYARVQCDLELVDAFIASEQLELADHTLSQALSHATEIETPYQKALALMQIAARLARREQTSRVSEVLFDALTMPALIKDRHQQSLALIQLADKYRELKLEAGEREQASLEAMMVKLE
jgi:tetratricopeptide (TPR) repeat protein